jgi:hypothetical protein
MKNRRWIVFSVALILIVGTAGALSWLKKNQKLGQPGIIFTPIPDSVQVKIDLPARVLDCTSSNMPESRIVLSYLPKDTSFAERLYTAADGFRVEGIIILMGADRTSIHNAEYCMTGAGYTDHQESLTTIPIGGPQPYDLSVSRWNVSGDFAQPDGPKVKRHGVYVFWFVADGEETPNRNHIMKRIALKLLTTGVLQRWAYVLYFSPCEAGQEDATFERMKKLIAASVPEFELPPAGTGGLKN